VVQPKTFENVLARDVSFETYMEYFAADFTEWVDGVVIKMSPVTEEHDALTQFFIELIRWYLSETGEGLLRVAPFVMRLRPGQPGREPDLHLILKERVSIVQRTMTDGPADIVIEIVSPESIERDTEAKYREYEAGGVREYWLVDPIKREATFYSLRDGVYQPIELADGVFRSTVLPRFRLNPLLLWQNPLPTGRQIAALVDDMLKGEQDG
jgi:Uma2 family endonuclease